MRVFALLLLLSVSFQVLAQEGHVYQYVDIGGNKIAYSCSGSGPNTVILIEGMGLTAHDSFKNIYHNYDSETYKICMYDRAGVGESSVATPGVRPMSELVEELHGVIQENHWKNIILVAHSFGGFVAQGYVHSHPEQVDAVLYAECAGTSWYGNMKRHMSQKGWAIMESIMAWEKNKHSREDFEEAFQAARGYSFPRDLPITVLSRGMQYTPIRQAGLSYFDVDVYNTTWNQSQLDLVALSDDAVQVVMRYSDHLVDEKDPWLVLDEIYKLEERIK